MKDAFIVIAATNDTLVNERIAQLAGESGKLINRVDDMGYVIVPSLIMRGDIVIGISTLGKSPAPSKYIRQMLEGYGLTIDEIAKPGMAHDWKSCIPSEFWSSNLHLVVIFIS